MYVHLSAATRVHFRFKFQFQFLTGLLELIFVNIRFNKELNLNQLNNLSYFVVLFRQNPVFTHELASHSPQILYRNLPRVVVVEEAESFQQFLRRISFEELLGHCEHKKSIQLNKIQSTAEFHLIQLTSEFHLVQSTSQFHLIQFTSEFHLIQFTSEFHLIQFTSKGQFN